MLMGSYGRQDPQWGLSADRSIAQVFTSTTFGADEAAILREDAIRYLIVDHRLTTALPLIGIYFDSSEPDAHRYVTPLDVVGLSKFDNVARVNTIFDSGDIVIYDVEHIDYP
jgi:hypothetical protein